MPMKFRSRLLIVLFLTVSALRCGRAQTAPPKPSAAEEAVVLSPFIVDTSAESGYQASSTLAGSRIKTDLKDVAASVTVLTTEFLDDLGAKDIASAMAFVAGAENDSTYHAEPSPRSAAPAVTSARTSVTTTTSPA